MQQLHTPPDAARWLHDQVRGALHTDSRRVAAGDGFIAWPGGVADGRRFVPAALAQGAQACLVEAEGAQAFDWHDGDESRIAAYAGLKAASGPIAAAYYEQPSARIEVLAITGTNGKTSTAWWLAHALQALGRRCALVGTLGVGEPGALEATGMTTPDPVLLQARLRDWADAGVQACAIEASSIGIAEHRLDGTQVRVAVFTNFTQDHLDYHGSMDAYWQAKVALFDWPGLRAAVVNIDDAQGLQLAQQLDRRAGLALWLVSCRSAEAWARDGVAFGASAHLLHAGAIAQGARGLRFAVHEAGVAHELDTALVGQYNVSNLLGVMAVLRAMGHALADVARVCAALPAVPGRMARVNADGDEALPQVVVDYAHTPDAVAQALQALRPLALARGGRLICVLGCGGDRDAAKRPLMAAAAERQADCVVLTSDNPRGEDPLQILAQMQSGLRGAAEVWPDRAQAIAHSVAQADARDVVLIAGKGHEDYQEVAGVRHPFSDVQQARAALQARRAHG